MSWIGQNWLVFGTVAGFILAVALMISEDAPVARRVFARFVFNIALPLLVIIGAPLLLLAAWGAVSAEVLPALIAGAVIAGGWLTSAIFAELGKAQAKAEKLRDYHKAIYAEIRNSLSVMYDEGRADEHAANIVERMKKEKDFVPFIPREHHDELFRSLVDEIEVLPRVTIDPVVAYYSLVRSMMAQAEDMRSKTFQEIKGQSRRIGIYEDYFETRKRAFAAGEITLSLIREYSDNGAQAAETLASALNNPVADPSDPEAGKV